MFSSNSHQKISTSDLFVEVAELRNFNYPETSDDAVYYFRVTVLSTQNQKVTKEFTHRNEQNLKTKLSLVSKSNATDFIMIELMEKSNDVTKTLADVCLDITDAFSGFPMNQWFDLESRYENIGAPKTHLQIEIKENDNEEYEEEEYNDVTDNTNETDKTMPNDLSLDSMAELRNAQLESADSLSGLSTPFVPPAQNINIKIPDTQENEYEYQYYYVEEEDAGEDGDSTKYVRKLTDSLVANTSLNSRKDSSSTNPDATGTTKSESDKQARKKKYNTIVYRIRRDKSHDVVRRRPLSMKTSKDPKIQVDVSKFGVDIKHDDLQEENLSDHQLRKMFEDLYVVDNPKIIDIADAIVSDVENTQKEKTSENIQNENLEDAARKLKEEQELKEKEKEQQEREAEEKQRQEREFKEQQEKEEKERQEKEERELKEKLEREEKERQEKELKEKLEREEKERKEREEKERQEKILKDQQEKELKEKQEREQREKEQKEKELKEQQEREEKERQERERVEREAKEQMEREIREKQEIELKEQQEREKQEKERLDREAKERQEREMKEKELKEQREKERLEKEMKEKELRDKLEKEQREKQEREERELKEQQEREQKQLKEKQERELKEQQEKELKEKQQKELKEKQDMELKKDLENEPKPRQHMENHEEEEQNEEDLKEGEFNENKIKQQHEKVTDHHPRFIPEKKQRSGSLQKLPQKRMFNPISGRRQSLIPPSPNRSRASISSHERFSILYEEKTEEAESPNNQTENDIDPAKFELLMKYRYILQRNADLIKQAEHSSEKNPTLKIRIKSAIEEMNKAMEELSQ